jgi:hypothetical protein
VGGGHFNILISIKTIFGEIPSNAPFIYKCTNSFSFINSAVSQNKISNIFS